MRLKAPRMRLSDDKSRYAVIKEYATVSKELTADLVNAFIKRQFSIIFSITLI